MKPVDLDKFNPTTDGYWTLVDVSANGFVDTYEHYEEHGKLVRVARCANYGRTETIVYVPLSPLPPHR